MKSNYSVKDHDQLEAVTKTCNVSHSGATGGRVMLGLVRPPLQNHAAPFLVCTESKLPGLTLS